MYGQTKYMWQNMRKGTTLWQKSYKNKLILSFLLQFLVQKLTFLAKVKLIWKIGLMYNR